MGEIVDLGNGVTYELPVNKPKTYRKVVSIISLDHGVTYEVTEYVPMENDNQHRGCTYPLWGWSRN